jgi:hypothetical protein
MQLFSQILGQYGKRTYLEFEKSLPYLQSALQLQLQRLGHLPPMDFSACDRIGDIEQKAGTFNALDSWLKTTHPCAYPELLKDLTVDKKLAFVKHF